MTKVESYHHGDLRAALLQAATDRLEVVGYEALSLRELASAIGVSPRAPYRHFESRAALLFAVALDGVEGLEAAYRRAAAMDAEPRSRLEALCLSYLGLAHERPQLFRLMFIGDIANDPKHGARWRAAIERTYALFERCVADCRPGASQSQIEEDAVAYWSGIHGFALLRMHDRLIRFMVRGHDEEGLVRALLLRLDPSSRP